MCLGGGGGRAAAHQLNEFVVVQILTPSLILHVGVHGVVVVVVFS